MLLVLLALPVHAHAGAAEKKPAENPGKLETPNTPAEADSAATPASTATVEPPAAAATPAAPAAPAGDANEAFQRGVALYKKDLYREALTEFNRALALDANNADAKGFAERCNAKLHLAAGGTNPAEVPTFETIDASNIDASKGAQQTAAELKKQRIKDLLALAQRYEEAQKWDTALQIYEEIRLQDPKNQEAIEGYHRSTMGQSKHEVADSGRAVDEEHEKTRAYIEEKKKWPEGADANGIKPYKFAVPQIEEKFEPEPPKTVIDEALNSPVSIEFEDIHINDVVSFLTDTYSINIIVDTRAVAPPLKVQPNTGGAPVPGSGQA